MPNEPLTSVLKFSPKFQYLVIDGSNRLVILAENLDQNRKIRKYRQRESAVILPPTSANPRTKRSKKLYSSVRR